MEKRKERVVKPDKKLAAVCGLLCEACTLYIATREDPVRLKKLAAQFGISEEKVKCHGCRSEKRGPYCQICHMTPCAARHGEAVREFLSRTKRIREHFTMSNCQEPTPLAHFSHVQE
jgi:hypothetical protein